MNDLEIYLKTKVDLTSYSSSIGYAGYFGYKDSFSVPIINQAIIYFDTFWKNTDENTLILASTLSIENSTKYLTDYCEYTKSDIDEYIMPLLGNRFIQIIDSNNSIEKFNLFSISRDDSVNLFKLFFVVMALGGLHGHIFVQFQKSGLILYPHDDGGFGLISQFNKNKHVESFLALPDKKMFNVVRHKSE